MLTIILLVVLAPYIIWAVVMTLIATVYAVGSVLEAFGNGLLSLEARVNNFAAKIGVK